MPIGAAVIPARDEAPTIAPIVLAVARRVECVIVVDDGSTDATQDLARSAGAVTLRHTTSRGVGAATLRGLAWARASGIGTAVTLDADGQHYPGWIDAAVRIRDSLGADTVLAERFHTLDAVPLTKQLSNNLAWSEVRRVLGFTPLCRDVSCGFRLYGPAGMSLVSSLDPAKYAGYGFVQASLVELHRAQIELASVDVPAIYPSPILGTSLSELVDVLCTIRLLGGEHVDPAWLSKLLLAGSASLSLTDWSTYSDRATQAILSGGYVRFS